jgi:DsbC/DsbD-like thiol-disulfide interchange protein
MLGLKRFAAHVMAWWVGLLLGLLWLHHPAWAQISGLDKPRTSTASVSPEVVTPQVRARLLAYAPQGVQAGQPLWLALQLQHTPQWHTYWQNPGDSGLPTQLEWQLPPGWQAGNLQWPLPHKLKSGPLTNYGYDGTALLVVPVQVNATPGTPINVRLHANWLVCRLECIPQEGDFALDLPAHTSLAADALTFQAVLQQQPQALPQRATSRFEGPHLSVTVSGLPANWQGQRVAVFPEQAELLDSAAEQHPLALQRWDAGVLQLRLPQSSMRTQSPNAVHWVLIAGSDNDRRAVRVTVDVPSPWPPAPAAALPVVAAETTGWGFWLALLGALAGGLILNLMPCVLPVLALKVMGFAKHSHAHRAHRIAGLAYTAGVLMSFLALGAAVLALRAAGEQLGWGFQLQSPWVVAGLALLFALIGFNLLGWVEVGHVLPASLLSLQARHPVLDAWLSGVLAVAVASPCTAPFMGASLGVAMTLPTPQALSIFAAMGLGLALPYLSASWWPGLATHMPKPGPWMVTLRRVLGVPMLLTVAWLVWVLSQQLGWVSAAAQAHDEWQPWSETAVSESLAAQRPVFVDFTAAWCVTCQVNKRTTLSDPEVLAELRQRRVTLLRADWTRRDPAITAALTQLGRSGVPVYVLLAPGQPPQVLSELLTPALMHEALAQLPATTP